MRAVNLIPAEQRSGASVGAGRSEGGAYALLAVVAGVAVLVFLYGSARHEVSSREKQVASLTTEAQREQAAAQQLAPYTSFVSLQQQREQAYDALVTSRFDWAHVFHEFGRVLPLRTSISSIDGSIGSTTTGAAPATAPSPSSPPSTSPSSSTAASSAAPASGGAVASATPPGAVPTFTLAGCATSQPVVAQMLQRLRLIDGVSHVALSTSATNGSGGGASGGCPAKGPSFTVTVTFDALPASTSTATAAGSASTTPAATASASATATQVSAK